MAEDFSGKVALVTGGGSGIGAATSRAFAAAGAQVAILDRNAAAAEAVAAEITGRNGHAAAYALDVADRDAFARLTEGITEAWGGIDILVNGAGTTVRRMIGEMGAEDWDRVIAVNLTGAFNGIQGVLPHMRARGGGAIVNIASIAGQRISFGGTANYTASKAGLLGLTRHAAYELAPDGIRVNAVCPGFIRTPMVARVMDRGSFDEKAIIQTHPINRLGKAEEIAEAVLWLSTDASSFVSGVPMPIDGAYLAQ